MTFGKTLLVALAAGTLLVGCSSNDAPTTEADSVTVREAWVKAADDGMTSAFAEIQNTGEGQVRVVSAQSPSSPLVELHEIVSSADGSMVMKPKDGGFVVAGGDTKVLQAGGDHIMLMGVSAPLDPGSDTEFTLTFEDGSTSTFTAQVREFAGAQENYGG
ncbi:MULTISPECIES: copper chaperone PCu(A)C [unclassified Rhodococcus (in: high G+C Gram-positive bacteria)]|uniref:copper chaperone PCu(A)C n=1 Tax=unclassified Rhodococcus (in: high G+C Gram-positive bacteria) TaxID=192944 RepID=UPI0033983E57